MADGHEGTSNKGSRKIEDFENWLEEKEEEEKEEKNDLLTEVGRN